MGAIDSAVEGWQASKINDGRWHTIPHQSNSFRKKVSARLLS